MVKDLDSLRTLSFNIVVYLRTSIPWYRMSFGNEGLVFNFPRVQAASLRYLWTVRRRAGLELNKSHKRNNYTFWLEHRNTGDYKKLKGQIGGSWILERVQLLSRRRQR